MYPPKTGYVIPDSLSEVIEFLKAHDDAKILAGGHSLIPMMKLRIVRPSYLVDITKLKELHYLDKKEEYKIGATVTHYEVSKAQIPLLSEVASKIGDPQVRNMGTIGGSISQLDPSADYPAALLVLNAKVKIKGPSGERTEEFSLFDKDMFTPDLSQGEVVTEVSIPDVSSYKYSYQKLERKAGDFAIVGVAVLIKTNGDEVEDFRIGVTGVNNKAYRSQVAEEMIKGRKINDEIIDKIAQEVADESNPTSDIRGSAEYKRKATKVMTKRAILDALKR
ncbi:glyceraldehyde dehydrogenase subunit beta [Acidianus sp. HS-5]|uniref:glyceraldehyde dehydrogenase subunit beta n=1 Tax=Acidianus sp. HS-5 TaxID=2886040 RepID=UPI001F36D47D|nr:glyceraldehyde dehydrogenase subunit beta [Acidianus sp. HS-5]BDC18146.1 carbon monoxide dehydrogenase [Acidianus sp. HS-5]